jgi:hypothetical protein
MTTVTAPLAGRAIELAAVPDPSAAHPNPTQSHPGARHPGDGRRRGSWRQWTGSLHASGYTRHHHEISALLESTAS